MKVSIIIPTYNRKNKLEHAVQSILSQTYYNWELLIIDDGSDDGSEDFFKKKHLRKDNRIIWKNRPANLLKGANTCRNIGIKSSTGDFIAFLDSDDEWLPERLDSAINYLKKTNAEAIYSGARIWNGKQEVIRDSRTIKEDESIFDFIIRHDTFAPTPSLIVKKEIAAQVLFDESLKRHQDFDFFLRISQKTNWMYFENYDVKVNWTNDEKRVLDYNNCLPFFKTHVHLSRDNSIKHNYILWLTEKSAKENPSKEVSKFFKEVLKKDGFKFNLRQKILFGNPFLFHWIFRFKRNL